MIENIGCLLTFSDNAETNDDPVIVIDKEKIAWVGSRAHMPRFDIMKTINADRNVVMPGFIDCHSHLIFAGTREDEFSRRMNNESYESIMMKGGGIMATVMKTRGASEQELLALARKRADAILKSGVTTLEIKSGYGLTVFDEIRILRLMKDLHNSHALDIHGTFLGAHVVPKELKENRKAYLEQIKNEMLPLIASERLAIDCDVFCETGAFTFDEAQEILSCAHRLGLGLRAHVQQFSQSNGVKLVLKLPITSISHADFLSDIDIEILGKQQVIVEALPIAALFLRSKNITPVRRLIEANVKLAIATDFNPGSAMCHDLILAARLGVTYFGFCVEEALRAITKNAAGALKRNDIGKIEASALADIVITNCRSKDEILYDWTKHPTRTVIKRGRLIV